MSRKASEHSLLDLFIHDGVGFRGRSLTKAFWVHGEIEHDKVVQCLR
nr:MAG TPA: hypothetical protein [Caudoviricetes sp.]